MLRKINHIDFLARVFCYINGSHHFDLLRNIFSNNKDIGFYVFSSNNILDDFRRDILSKLDNVFFISDFEQVSNRLNIFSVFITTDAQRVKPHLQSLLLIEKFSKVGVKTIELQHGLFQLGLHYYDEPRKDFFNSDSLPSWTRADMIATFFPPSILGGSDNKTVTIGYPPYLGTDKYKSNDGSYVLILTNLHWNTYSLNDKSKFYSLIFDYINKNKDITFIWKLHHGEIQNTITNNLIKLFSDVYNCKINNLLFVNKNNVLKMIHLDELIKKSKYVISTPTTCLLDVERFAKPCLIYKCSSNSDILPQSYDHSIFYDYNSLEERTKNLSQCVINSGLLRSFDNTVFRKIINL